MVKKVCRVLEVLILTGASLYTAFNYGTKLGTFVCGVMFVGFVFLNLELFKSFYFMGIKAEMSKTRVQIEKVDNFFPIFLKSELRSFNEGLTYETVYTGNKDIKFELPSKYSSLKRIYDLYKTIEASSDDELKKLLFDKQKQILQEYIAIFNQIIQSYLNYYSGGFKESEDDINRIPQLKHINDTIKEFSRTRKIDFKALDACYQELLKLDGDKAYLTLNWDKCIKSIKDITE